MLEHLTITWGVVRDVPGGFFSGPAAGGEGRVEAELRAVRHWRRSTIGCAPPVLRLPIAAAGSPLISSETIVPLHRLQLYIPLTHEPGRQFDMPRRRSAQ